jgi:hypothetical protein
VRPVAEFSVRAPHVSMTDREGESPHSGQEGEPHVPVRKIPRNQWPGRELARPGIEHTVGIEICEGAAFYHRDINATNAVAER